MSKLKEFLKWHLDNPHNLNFKMIVSYEEREETMKEMQGVVNILDTGLTPDEINALRERDIKSEEDITKFYYCESEDDYYIGKRVENLYYAKYGPEGFTWFMSRYLPWGQHIVAPETAWKEYTFPSEPKEIPFTEWLDGFIRKHMSGKDSDVPTNDGWIPVERRLPEKNEYFVDTSSNKDFPNGYYRRLEIAYMTDTMMAINGWTNILMPLKMLSHGEYTSRISRRRSPSGQSGRTGCCIRF